MNAFISSSFPRRLEDEALDHLSQSDPHAVHSRRDLQRINRIMGSAKIISDVLSGARMPLRIIELGAGDGTTMLRVAQHFQGKWPQVHLTLLDRQNLMSKATYAAFGRMGWAVDVICDDLQNWMREPTDQKWDVGVANLFVHHFDEVQISSLFRALCERTDLFIACEPRRTYMSLLASRLVGMIGANAVTRKDAVLSVRAGFRDGELSKLWPAAEWLIDERAAGLFSHLFVARKNTC